MPAPIALFAFNRPDHLCRTLDALANNDLAAKCDLTIFCDGPRNDVEKLLTEAVREAAHAEVGAEHFASTRVVERSENLGCANAVIAGLTEMFAVHERLIVIEDDILCSPHTLAFLNEALERYADYKAVWNISAWSPAASIFPVPENYLYDVYAIPRFNCWGWASWRDRFELVDWSMPDYALFTQDTSAQEAFNRGGADLTPMLHSQMKGAINSWAIRMDYARFKHGCVGLNPIRSYTTNIGMGSGTHTTIHTTRWDNDEALAKPVDNDLRWLEHVFVDERFRTSYCNALCPHRPWAMAAVRKILRILGLLA